MKKEERMINHSLRDVFHESSKLAFELLKFIGLCAVLVFMISLVIRSL